MNAPQTGLDLARVRVYPLRERKSMSRLEEVLVDLDAPLPTCNTSNAEQIRRCADQIREARDANATVSLIYGAHLIKNGAALIVRSLIDEGWITHLATNGAGIIHDWEFAYLGASTERVRENVAQGCFGTWLETGTVLNLVALLAGATHDGFGSSLGRLISEQLLNVPTAQFLRAQIVNDPASPHAAGCADLLAALETHAFETGEVSIRHPYHASSIVARAWQREVPFTVHPGIGYDIISNHPMFHGAAIGRAASVDFQRFAQAVEGLDQGVVLSVGSAIMGPQVFEKTMSCVNNIRLQEGRQVVQGHKIHVVDLQDGGNWDWSTGEPPHDNPAYYLRFCKSYARMGGTMYYLNCDNVVFLRHLHHYLRS